MKIPKPLVAVPIQGEKVLSEDGAPVGVVVGYGWVTNDDHSPTMRPVVLIAIKGGAVAALPAEMANTIQSSEERPLIA